MAGKPETRELIQRRLETQLREWSTRIDHLKAAAERDMADAELREQFYDRLQRLRDRQTAAVEKLEELKRSGAKAWQSVKKDIDRLWSDIQDAFEGLPTKRGRAKPPARPGRWSARRSRRAPARRRRGGSGVTFTICCAAVAGMLCSASAARATYADRVLQAPDLVAYWRFETATQADSSVNGFTGAFQGDAALSEPGGGAPLAGLPDDRCVILDGDGDYVVTDLDTEVDFPDAATFIVWAYLAVQPSQAGRIFTVAGKSQVGNDLDLQIEPDDQTKFFTDSVSSTAYADPLPVRQWVHLAATFDDVASARRIYVNGMRVASDSPVPGHAPGANAFGIGESLVFRGRFFQGRLDEVALFSRALSDAEIQDIYRAAFATADPTATSTPEQTATPTATPTTLAVCVGDCNGNRLVSVDELVHMVTIALGTAAVSGCPAGDGDADGDIAIHELLQAVNNDLRGCPEPGTAPPLFGRTQEVAHHARHAASGHALQRGGRGSPLCRPAG